MEEVIVKAVLTVIIMHKTCKCNFFFYIEHLIVHKSSTLNICLKLFFMVCIPLLL